MRIFGDRGISGAGTDRPAYEKMMRLVTNKPRELDVIVIEDLSRLSRAAADLFTLQRLFEFLEIRLVGIADGIDTFAKHSTLTFGLKSLVSSIYLEDLRTRHCEDSKAGPSPASRRVALATAIPS